MERKDAEPFQNAEVPNPDPHAGEVGKYVNGVFIHGYVDEDVPLVEGGYTPRQLRQIVYYMKARKGNPNVKIGDYVTHPGRDQD